MDMTRVPWLHQKLRTLVVPLLLNDASLTSVNLYHNNIGAAGARARLGGETRRARRSGRGAPWRNSSEKYEERCELCDAGRALY